MSGSPCFVEVRAKVLKQNDLPARSLRERRESCAPSYDLGSVCAGG